MRNIAVKRPRGKATHVSNLGSLLYKEERFPSKSGGKLHVLFQLGSGSFTNFFGRNKTLRIYRVCNIPKGGVGADEFHKRRSEIISVEKGSFKLLLEDIYGRKKIVRLREGTTYGIIPPYTLHTYVALSAGAAIQVVANTLYDHKKTRTHDTYSADEFRRMQALSHL